MSTETAKRTHLDSKQRQRAEALDRARVALAQRNFVGSGATTGKELVGVASYIVTGVDPYRAKGDV